MFKKIKSSPITILSLILTLLLFCDLSFAKASSQKRYPHFFSTVLIGRVTNSLTLRPIPGASIQVLNRRGRVIASTTTDTQGRYLIRRRLFGYFLIRASANNYQPKTVFRFLRPGRVYNINFSLQASTNQPPSVGTIIPSSGISYLNQPVNFTTTYSDPNGWQDIRCVWFLVTSATNRRERVYGYYNQNTNRIYLGSSTYPFWLGGFFPGSDKVIENSYLRLDCSKTITSTTDNNTLTVKWNIAFKPQFTGRKFLYLRVRDNANAGSRWSLKGNWNVVSDNIPPTGTIKINNGASYTNSTQVTLGLFSQDNEGGSGVDKMQFSNDNLNWSDLQDYAETKTWKLSSGDSKKTVYVKFKDRAGNYSEPISATILLDTTPPTISIVPVNTPTNQDVLLSYTVTDNFTPQDEIKITGDESPYTEEGDYSVTLTAKDKAGNLSSLQINFTIDKTPPLIIITSPPDGAIVEDPEIRLEGTIDSIAFSEIRTLTEGENILTKTAKDLAGNTASASVKVYLYLAQLIGPEGGEVTSSDGKIKVIIPPGALSEPTPIRVLSVNQESLKESIPSHASLLGVAECKPYGLVFKKPAQIIYTLSEAEIPGTPIELGLYDSIQKKLILTGNISSISTDSYTVIFSIMHFSTYGALKNLIPTVTPIGAGVKIPLPDMFTGSFSHAIPITLSPGRKGLQPNLALVYLSSNPNSWTGLGFSLNPGYIIRSTRLGPPTYIDTQDTFYLVTDLGATELVHLTENLYQAKIESGFSKFFKEPDDSWKVIAKDGSILRFGQTPNSKETSGQGTFSWYLTKAIDTNKNYIEYHYTKDQAKVYLSRIDYTGNEIGISPTNSVEFLLEPREDVLSSYISGSKITTAKRLREIQVRVNYDLVWRYTLEYTYSQDTNRSLLKSVIQYASNDKNFPQQRFEYQRAK